MKCFNEISKSVCHLLTVGEVAAHPEAEADKEGSHDFDHNQNQDIVQADL